MIKHILFIFILFLTSTSFLISQNQLKGQPITKKTQKVQNNSLGFGDSVILAPESLNESISSLLNNWQIDFSESVNHCNQGVNVAFSDSVYMQRLYNLPTEMELSFNSVVRSYIEMYTNRRRDLVSYMLSLGNYYYPMFEEALDRYELPLELKYLPVIESALNPVAVSRMGATGLWQFMLRTGKEYNLEVNSLVDERRDPYKSTDAAARYLKSLYQIYGDWNLVIAAYNCGPGNVNKAIARSGGKRDYWDIYYNLPRETRGYVPVFIAANYVMNYNGDHNICRQETSNDFMSLDTIHVSDEIHFKQISEVLDIPIEDIRRYNPQFKQDIIPGNHKPYTLVLPAKQMYAYISNSDKIKNHNSSIYLTNRKQTLINEFDGTAINGPVKNTYYKIKKGDTLGSIARRNRISVVSLQRLNGMKTTRLSVGKNLIVRQAVKSVNPQTQLSTKVLASSGELKNTYYKVKKGDTLGSLARSNRTTVSYLKRINGMNSTTLTIGRNIILRQERLQHEPVIEVEIEDAEEKYPDVDLSSISSSESIISEYIDNYSQKKVNSHYQVIIL